MAINCDKVKLHGLLVQMARTPALHAGGREFESRTVHKILGWKMI